MCLLSLLCWHLLCRWANNGTTEKWINLSVKRLLFSKSIIIHQLQNKRWYSRGIFSNLDGKNGGAWALKPIELYIHIVSDTMGEREKISDMQSAWRIQPKRNKTRPENERTSQNEKQKKSRNWMWMNNFTFKIFHSHSYTDTHARARHYSGNFGVGISVWKLLQARASVFFFIFNNRKMTSRAHIICQERENATQMTREHEKMRAKAKRR